MGHFTSPDPGGLLTQNQEYPQSWNLYEYVRNSPLTNIDPTGLDCVYANDAGMGSSQSITTAVPVSADRLAELGYPVMQMRAGPISTGQLICFRWLSKRFRKQCHRQLHHVRSRRSDPVQRE